MAMRYVAPAKSGSSRGQFLRRASHAADQIPTMVAAPPRVATVHAGPLLSGQKPVDIDATNPTFQSAMPAADTMNHRHSCTAALISRQLYAISAPGSDEQRHLHAHRHCDAASASVRDA